MSRPPVVLATRSVGKLGELCPLIEAHGFAVVDLEEAGVAYSPEEDELEAHPTFEGNALAKARYFFERTGRPTIADDSGLVVKALGGAPGVRSKRWSGRLDLSGAALDDENNRRLLDELRGVDDRSAKYVCAAAYVDELRELVERGEVEGRIVDGAQGNNGFGYDPYFWSNELGRTFGEVNRETKERVSHRGRALRRLLARIQ